MTEPAKNELEHRRRNARRTAYLVAAVAVAIYAMFWLSGVIGR